ncbi:MAG: dihydrodipicolinate synthase family protein [Saprospiraceae bacterium]|nr:dihydrodipicolinate synthase family protein [Saprospiraceae bacterium]
MKDTLLPNGVYVAALTPLKADLTPDIEMLADHCQSLLATGAQGLALMGTTGEANSFSIDERKELLEQLLAKGVDPKKIMLGTGCCSYTDTIDLTSHALKMGVSSILLLPPFYYKQISDNDLYTYFKMVIEAVGKNDLEIYLYHFPKMTGLNFSLSLLEKLIHDFPANFVGMKDSGGDPAHMAEIIAHFPGFKLFAGTEKYLLDVLRLGGAGCISATANITAPKCVEVFEYWQSDLADALQQELVAQRNIFEGLPFVGILKQSLAEIKDNPQWLHVRPPNGLVPNEFVKQVLGKIEAMS